MDTQRVGVEVEGYADLAALNNAVRGVSEEFVRTLELERAAINSPALAQIDAGDLYYVAGAESYPVDWRDTLHARGGEWLGGLDGICTSGYEIEGLYCLERRTTGGDSGGPVYYESGSDAIAAGTVAFSMKKSGFFTTTKWYTCYQTVTDIEAATGYSVVTS